MRKTNAVRRGLLAAVGVLLSAAAAAGQTARKDDYDRQLQGYLQAARALPPQAPTPDGLWMASMFADLRARRVNDLVTVRVVENVVAAGTADSSLDKNSSGTASLPRLFGLDTKFPGWLDPTSLAQASANTQFSGGGSTTRTGSLTAVITARVVEVLPNNDLVLEGIREVDVNGDRQVIVLTGIVRTADIAPGNVVLSSAVGQMQIRYFGQGLIRDNLRPGWVIRLLNKVF